MFPGFRGFQRPILSSLLLGLAWLVFSLTEANAQIAEIDTLYYYNVDSLTTDIVFTANLVDLACFFVPDSSWPAYDLLEMQVLVNEGITIPFNFSYSVHISSDSSQPGELICSGTDTIRSENEVYPYWNVIDLTENDSLTGMTSPIFWIRSLGLLDAMYRHLVPGSGHLLGLITSPFYLWGPSGEAAIRVLVRRNDTVDILKPSGLRLPSELRICRVYPNPFNPVSTIRYDLPQRAEVALTVYDILGREVRTLVAGMQEAGYKSAVWDGTDDRGQPVSSGVYLYRIQAGGFTQTRKMALLR